MAAETESSNANIQNGQPENANQLSQLLSVSTIVLRQGLDLVANHLTSDEQLTVSSQYLPGSTIGKHLRHARDHFVLLLDCISSSSRPCVFSYDVRNRNTPMESSRSAAQETFLETMQRLAEIVPGANLDEPMTLHAVTPYKQVLETTFGRELWFAALHCVHHWSMVRVIAGELNIQLPDDFGFAPSTLVHQGKAEKLRWERQKYD